MGRVELTEEQRQAIYAPGNVLVRAGAGSGKTEVLARRFVALLAGDIAGREPLAPERIAAITFTESATADMRRRIADVLDERVARENEPARRAALIRARRTLGLARISTIHAFCARLLRECPLEAGIDPGFEVLDEYQTMTFLERHCRELVADAVRRADAGAVRLVRTRGFSGFAHRPGAVEMIQRMVVEAARLGHPPSWIRTAAEITATRLRGYAGAIPAQRARLVKLVDGLLSRSDITGKSRDKIELLREQWSRLKKALSQFSADSEPSALDTLAELSELRPNKTNPGIKPALAEIDDALDKLREAYGACHAADPTREVAELAADVGAELERRKIIDHVVTFDDLLILANRVLGTFPEVAARHRRQFSAMLVDEYQDTDPIQDSVVRLLTQHEPPAPELFIVGDEKQSIYRFRGADVTVFNAPRPPLVMLARPLVENRRSLPAIIELVNSVSARSMRPEEHEGADDRPYWVRWTDSHRLKPVRPAADARAVELIVSPRTAHSRDQEQSTRVLRRLEAEAIAARCAQLIDEGARVFDCDTGVARAARFGDIALLLRSFSDVAIYENAFIRAGVPSYTVKGRGFYDRREVKDMAALLGAVEDPQNQIDLVAALRSPLFGLSDQCLLEIALHLRDAAADDSRSRSIGALFHDPDEDFSWLVTGREAALKAREVLAALRAMRGRAPLSAIVERGLELTQFEAVMLGLERGCQRAANLRKLLEVARDFETHRFFGLGDFVSHLRRLISEAPLEPQAQVSGEHDHAVRLMTIHQAKGLEFPIAILADLSRQPRGNTESILMTPAHGLLVPATIGAGNEELPNPLIQEHRKRVRDEESAESARLLYVAMTRARDRLILSEGGGARPGKWIRHVRDAIGAERIATFAGGDDPEAIVNTAGGEVVLLRAQALASRPRGRDRSSGTSSAARLLELAPKRLGFAPPAIRELVVSPSALEDFERCPRQYYLRHEIGLPEDETAMRPGSDAPERDRAAVLGTIAHAVLEQLDAPPPAAADALEATIERLVAVHGAGAALTGAERRTLIRDLMCFVSGPDYPGRDSGRTALRETPFFITLEESGFTLHVRGRIDLLTDDGERLVVSDYKYGRPGAADYRLQMECYALAAAKALPGREVSAEIIYLRERAERRALALAPAADTRAHLLGLGRALAAARASGDYPRRPPDASACRALGCGYVGRCRRA